MWWLLLIPGALIVFLGIIVIRAAVYSPKPQPIVSDKEECFDRDRSIEALRTLVRCKTVSYRDSKLEDDAEFEKLIDSLPTLYPNVHNTCEFRRFPDRGLLFKWRGRTNSAPAVMMAHYDVVPINEEGWDLPAFEAIIKDGCVWGRGTLD